MLYPNPSNGIFSIGNLDIEEIRIFDTNGILVYEGNSKYVKIDEYKEGVYYAMIKGKHGE